MSDRGRRRQRTAIECWFWASIFFLLAFILIVIRISGSKSPQRNEFHTYNLDRLEKFASTSGQFRVVMIGDSRLKYATLGTNELHELAAGRGLNVVFFRVIQEQAQFSDFSPFLGPILATDPDLILVHEPLFVRDRTLYTDARLIQRYLVWAIRRDDSPLNPRAQDQEALQHDTECPKSRSTSTFREFASARLPEQTRRANGHFHYDPAGKNAGLLDGFVARAESAGVEVVALATEDTSLFRKAMLNSPATQAIDRRKYTDPANTWRYAGTIADERYCDLVHLDPDGRREYSKWLIDAIVQKLTTGPATANEAE